jgi:ADP-heptose:LPS heptosyltransferase
MRRRWPAAHFAFIGDSLAAAGYTILLTGDTGEKALTEQVAALMDFPAVDLVATTGHTGLGELAALIENAAALLCNDTGVSHIASATKTPSVIVFSAYSDPERWAPLNKKLHIPIPKEQAADPVNALKALYQLLNIKMASVSNESFHTHSYA